ncbi:MAG: hypothetical protein QW757_00465 [Candidatus Woesearchaeota archaeon]
MTLPWKGITFRVIKELSNKKSESYVYSTLKKFVNEGILIEKKVGNVILYYLDLKSLKSQLYSGNTAEYIAWHKKNISYGSLNKITEKIPIGFIY